MFKSTKQVSDTNKIKNKVFSTPVENPFRNKTKDLCCIRKERPIAAVTNCHKVRHLKQYKCIILQL